MPVGECAQPVGECVQPSECKQVCPPQSCTQTATVIRRSVASCSTLPPVGEITVTRSQCSPTKMVFVSVLPTDDRCFNPESRNFERPWPWGPNNIGSCNAYCR
jgi:hypothetical protein